MRAQRRHRSAVACRNCRRRKVRCSVTVTGIPCSNCTQDRTACTIQEVSHELLRSPIPVSQRQVHSSELIGATVDKSSYAPVRNDSQALYPDRHDPPVRNSHSSLPGDGDPGNAQLGKTPVRLDPERQRNLEEEQSGAEISFAARGQGDSNSGTPFYTGEQPSMTSLIDVEEHFPRHVMLRHYPPSALSQADLQYLKHKGALSPLLMFSHQELLRAYFQHVHPMLPVLHLSKLEEMKSPDAIPLHGMLLYWSMAVVAVNFVPSDVWKAEKYSSRKHMKDTMYNRAKCLYDNTNETNKEVLLQSALLLSFWHSEKDSHSQPWYWSGVAINWCQIIGLHRDPDAARVNPLVSPQRRHLWRRLWACCMFRDRWLSLTLGRPLRIRLSDCDMPLPVSHDVLVDLEALPSDLHAYLPGDLVVMVEHWILLIQLCKILGEILLLCYQQLGNRPLLSQFEALETDLNSFSIPELKGTDQGSLASFSYYHSQLHLQATSITFYRSFVSVVPEGLATETAKSWTCRVRSRMESAATQTNSIIDHIAREGLVIFATPMTPILLVPAMHVHVLGCKSENHLTRRLAFNKLEMCMTFMRELQRTYTSASIFCGVFGEAIRQLVPGPLNESIWGVAQSEYPSTIGTLAPDSAESVAKDDLALQPVVSDDILESLLDENSTYNFWESMNMPDQYF
ncbi:uncharacterized protein M421DRAFT_425082 [Didymella exigua CBS 183.55]|uniref:Zn(2)-C6 fungal-type domain-containing protein n=1 Tax=Didymella exigua CBS 183.55 TaxID=1150837 RepID=A0A6A5R7C3_9PLEO|nr:uncharacterized protein M421DRAFT_425082 [Didymella exigua CBS 183.55]KAF1924065.1 hypothetical protein M421DRAFT_425082 [Didymella exigua CBS 183.55]